MASLDTKQKHVHKANPKLIVKTIVKSINLNVTFEMTLAREIIIIQTQPVFVNIGSGRLRKKGGVAHVVPNVHYILLNIYCNLNNEINGLFAN